MDVCVCFVFCRGPHLLSQCVLPLVQADLSGSLELQSLLGHRVAESLHALHCSRPGRFPKFTLVHLHTLVHSCKHTEERLKKKKKTLWQ